MYDSSHRFHPREKMERKKQTPSVIARLMGLDELPPREPVHNQRVLSEDYLRKTASIGLVEKRSFCAGRLSRYETKKQHIITEVFDVDNPKMNKHRESATATHIDTGADLHLKSCRFQRYLQQPATLAVRQSKDLQTVQQLSDSWHTGASDKTDMIAAQGNLLRSLQNFQNGSSGRRYAEHDIDHITKLWKPRLDPKHKKFHSSTKIVVLKPTCGKMLHAAQSGSGLQPCPEITEHAESLSPEDAALNHKTDSGTQSSLAQLYKSITHVPWGTQGNAILDVTSNGSYLAKEAKNQISERLKMTKGFLKNKVTGQGQTLGEMLAMPDQDVSPSYLDLETDKHTLYPPLTPRGDSKLRPLGICSKDGWKYESPRILPRSRSKASQSSWSARQEDVDKEDNNTREQVVVLENSLGRNDSTGNIKNCQHSGPTNSEENQNKEQSSAVSGLSTSSVPRMGEELSQPKRRSSQEIQDELQNILEEKDMSREPKNQSRTPNSVVEHLLYGGQLADVLDDAEVKGIVCGVLKERRSETMPCILSQEDDDHFSTHVNGISPWQEPSNCTRVFELPMNLAGNNQPSPNSVLEPLEDETLSTSTCSEFAPANSSTDFYGLRRQLQLLKSELDTTDSEGSGMVVSSDEDSDVDSMNLSEASIKHLDLLGAEESRDFSYLVDVLDEFGHFAMSLELSSETLNSLECPIKPSVFEALEKKYGKQISWPRSQRKLLFDLINEGLREILESCMSMDLWVKSLRRNFGQTLRRDNVEEELWTLLVKQDQDVNKSLSEKALETEMNWLNLEEDGSAICTDIEKVLFDELVAELVSSESI